MRNIPLFIFIFISLCFHSTLVADNIDSIKQELTQHPNTVSKLDVYYDLTKALVLSKPKEAMNLAREMLALATELKNFSGISKANNQIGVALCTQGDFILALNYFEKSLKANSSTLDTLLKAKILNNIGLNHTKLDNYTQANSFYEESLAIKRKIGDRKGASKTIMNIGLNYYRMFSYDKALEYFLESLKIKKEEGLDLTSLQFNIAHVLQISKQNEEAINQYKSLETSLSEKGSNNSYFNIYEGLIYCYLSIKNYRLAEFYIEKGLKIASELNSDLREGKMYLLKGRLNIEQNQLNQAKIYLDRVLEINDSAYNAIAANLYLADISWQLNNIELADGYYQRSIQLAKKWNEKESFQKIYEKYSNYLIDINDYKNGVLYLKKSISLKDSLTNKVNNYSLLELQEKYGAERRKQKINGLQTKNKNLSQELEMYKIYAFVVLCSIIFLGLGIGYWWFHQTKRKLQQTKNQWIDSKLNTPKQIKNEELLMLKNKELLANSILLSQQQEIGKKIVNQLTPFKKSLKVDQEQDYEKILSSLDRIQRLNSKESFRKYFVEIHPDFYKNLTKKFPNLSSKEQKLCAFLKLNLDSKEIADLLYISYKSVAVSRSRLRKKLGLTNVKISLNEYLNQI